MSILLVIIASVLFCQQGVVVIEDIAQLNQLLRVPNQEPDVLLKSLQQLSQKLPSREILKSTKIGCYNCIYMQSDECVVWAQVLLLVLFLCDMLSVNRVYSDISRLVSFYHKPFYRLLLILLLSFSRC